MTICVPISNGLASPPQRTSFCCPSTRIYIASQLYKHKHYDKELLKTLYALPTDLSPQFFTQTQALQLRPHHPSLILHTTHKPTKMKASYPYVALAVVATATFSPVASFQLPLSRRPGARMVALSLRAAALPALQLHPTTPCPTHYRSSLVLCASSRESAIVDEDDDENTPGGRGPRTYITALAWLGFVSYAFLLAPGKDPAATALDAQLLKVS